MNRLAVSLFAALLMTAASPQDASAQMRAFEQGMGRLKARLSPSLYDGKQLNVTTWKQMRKVEDFVRNYKRNLEKTIKAWNALTVGKNTERLNKLKAAQAYFKALFPLYAARRKQITPPKKVVKVKVENATFDQVVTGPGASVEGPALIDFFGPQETTLQAWGSPGTRSKPSMWSVRMQFVVKYKGFTSSDFVTAQIYKGRKKLGRPINCAPHVLKGWPVAVFKCRSDHRDRKKMYKTAGAHLIKLSYKNLVLGKTFKNFATLRLDVLKLWGGSLTRPAVMWRTNHDSHMPPSVIVERNTSWRSGHRDSYVAAFMSSAMSAMNNSNPRHLVLHTWVKRNKYFSTQATCVYKGKPVWEPFRENGRLDWEVSGRLKKGRKAEFKAKWQKLRFLLQGLKIVNKDGRRGSWSKEPHWLDKNPGEYKCVITGDGKAIKEVYFTVGADGHLVKPACQDKILTTFKDTILVKAKSKKWGELKWNKGKYAFCGNVKWNKACP